MKIFKSSAWMGMALAFAAFSAEAVSPPRLTVVYKGGKTVTTVLPMSYSGQGEKTTGVCAGDDAALFAFTEKAVLGTDRVSRAEGESKRVAVETDVVCSNFSGTARLDYSANTTALGPDVGVSVTPPSAMINLSNITPGTGGPSGTAEFTVEINNQAISYPEDVAFPVNRTGGHFDGLDFRDGPEGVSVIQGIDQRLSIFSVTVEKGTPPPPPDEIVDVPDDNDDPYQGSIYASTATHCTDNIGTAECQAFSDLAIAAQDDPEALSDLQDVLRAISPEKATSLASTGTQLAAGQVGNVAMRVASLMHGTGGGLSTSGLTLVGGGMPLSLDMLGDVLNAAGDDRNEEKRTLLGGTRWGVWLNGTIGGGTHERYKGNSGFDFRNWSLTAGADYRITDAFFLGGAAGFSRLNSEFDEVKDWMDADSYALHLYAGYGTPKGFSLDASVSRIHTIYDLFRYLPNPGSTNLTQLNYLTKGSPDSLQISGSIGASWYFQGDVWTLAPTLQYQFMSTDIDAFEERGQSFFRLAYEKQHVVTRSLSGGVYADYAFATDAGTFRPYLRALLYKDSGTGAYNLVARFVESGSPINAVMLAEPDRSYGTAELGLSFRRPVGTRTVDFNFGALKMFDFEALDRWSVRADVRVPF